MIVYRVKGDGVTLAALPQRDQAIEAELAKAGVEFDILTFNRAISAPVKPPAPFVPCTCPDPIPTAWLTPDFEPDRTYALCEFGHRIEVIPSDAIMQAQEKAALEKKARRVREPDPFEEPAKREDNAARILKPFMEGRFTKADCARVEDKGLPPLLYAASIYPPPSTSIRALEPEEVDDFIRRQKAQWQKFRKFALLYGWAGELARTLNQDKGTVAQVLLHALGQNADKPNQNVLNAVMRVVRDGPAALEASDWNPMLQPVREKLDRLLRHGVPVTRDALPQRYRENKEILNDLGLFEQAHLLWYWWCPGAYRGSRGHRYVADRRRQKACVRHQKAGRQARLRRRRAEASAAEP
jgi:hypothetical protein